MTPLPYFYLQRQSLVLIFKMGTSSVSELA